MKNFYQFKNLNIPYRSITNSRTSDDVTIEPTTATITTDRYHFHLHPSYTSLNGKNQHQRSHQPRKQTTWNENGTNRELIKEEEDVRIILELQKIVGCTSNKAGAPNNTLYTGLIFWSPIKPNNPLDQLILVHFIFYLNLYKYKRKKIREWNYNLIK